MRPALAAEPDNLVLKAARLLADRAGVAPRAAIRLAKHIPVAAGLGGGSADAAAALRELGELWRVALPEEELFDLAARLGRRRADVPGRPRRAGVGLGRAPEAGAGLAVLRHPAGQSRHGAADARRFRRAPRPVLAARARDAAVAAICRSLSRPLAVRGNDLSDAAISLLPGDRRGAGIPARQRGRTLRRHERQRRHLLCPLRLARRRARARRPPCRPPGGAMPGRSSEIVSSA